MAVALSLASLPKLPERVARPGYARADLSPGILHFGIGNFHRAHLQVYLDRLMNAGRDRDWAIVGAGVTPYDVKMRDALFGQDWLSTVVEQSAGKSEARVTGAMTDFLPPMDTRAIVAALADPRIRTVSLTVTEGGYFVIRARQVRPREPGDRRRREEPRRPEDGVRADPRRAEARRAAGNAPFTVMSCDNVPHNGKVCRDAVAGLAAAQDAGFAGWVRDTVAFPNAMVDRIAPATSDRERQITRDEFGIEDAWPGVLRGLPAVAGRGRLPCGAPGVRYRGCRVRRRRDALGDDEDRILNGGHAIIAYPAGLMDIHFVHEGMQNELVRAFLQKVEREEIIPIVPPVPGTDLDGYFRKVEERCLNPKIGDTIRRLCLDGSNRQPKFIIPSIADRLERGLPVPGLALESALWCRYCFGTTNFGKAIEPNDPNWDRLQAQARAAKEDPSAWLGMRDIYGAAADAPAFATPSPRRWRRSGRTARPPH